MKLLLVLLSLFSVTAHAYVVPLYRDLKPATQAMLEHDLISNPAVAASNDIKSAFAGPTSAAAVTLTSFLQQPDVPRNLVITPGTDTTDVAACVITVTGTNINSEVITETFTFADDASSAVTGAKAFASITSVAWPASCEDNGFGATWSIGQGEKLGLNHCLDHIGNVAWASAGGVYESTRPTCVADADEVEKNTCDVNATMDASADFDIYYVQNFRCN